MSRLAKAVVIALLLSAAPTSLAGSSSAVPGVWRPLPSAPFTIPQSQTSVWTGREMIVFGRKPLTNPSVAVAEAYDPVARTWKVLSPPAIPTVNLAGYKVVWTGRQMLVFGTDAVAYVPSSDRWRQLPKSIEGGIVVWTGREAIGWGGGCCGDAWSTGTAYNPRTDRNRKLPRSPLAPSQSPLGAWTGRELVLFVGGWDPSDKAYPARLARAAAYDPATNRWRRIAPLPTSNVRYGFLGTAVWDGHEVLVTGTGSKARSAFAYDPATNRWRPLAPLPASRFGGTTVWTGKQLFVWGGQSPGATTYLGDGLAYDPRTNRWSSIPRAPLHPRGGSAVEWTGRSLIVSGGAIPRKVGAPTFTRDGAAFTPSR